MAFARAPFALWVLGLLFLAVCVFWQTRNELRRNASENEYLDLQQIWGKDETSEPVAFREITPRETQHRAPPMETPDKPAETLQTKPLSGKETNLIIISQGRSGSSFLGEIFNQHPEVLYFFEPFRVLELVDKFDTFIGAPTRRYDDLATMFLGELLDCNVKASEYFTYFSRPGHFRFSSKVLREPPFCQPDAAKLSLQEIVKKNLCTNVEASVLNNACKKQHKVTAVKLLEHRLMGKRIANLRHLFETEAYKSQIVYLVRDPRAVISSMYRGSWMTYVNADGKIIFHTIKSEQFLSYVKKICNQMHENLRFVMNPPRWLKGRLKVIRYEDLIVEPVKVTRELFEFVDLSFPSEMRQWLHNRTHFKETTLNDREGVFSTKRNSTISLRKWRLKTPRDMINVVESHCSHVMNTMGYLHSHGSPELLSRVDIPLVTRKFADKLKR